MIDFEQEIETRLALFQHLTGKGNIKDGNRTLYEIVRLMLGMITNQNGAGSINQFRPGMVSQLQPVVAPDASPSREVPLGCYQIQVASPPSPPEPFETPEIVAIIEEEALTYSKHDAPTRDPILAPYGYTRAGHVRLVPLSAPYGFTESGLPRKTPIKK
jgi:hypothetical protein